MRWSPPAIIASAFVGCAETRNGRLLTLACRRHLEGFGRCSCLLGLRNTVRFGALSGRREALTGMLAREDRPRNQLSSERRKNKRVTRLANAGLNGVNQPFVNSIQSVTKLPRGKSMKYV